LEPEHTSNLIFSLSLCYSLSQTPDETTTIANEVERVRVAVANEVERVRVETERLATAAAVASDHCQERSSSGNTSFENWDCSSSNSKCSNDTGQRQIVTGCFKEAICIFDQTLKI